MVIIVCYITHLAIGSTLVVMVDCYITHTAMVGGHMAR